MDARLCVSALHGGDESLFRRYHGWWSRFKHPDPYDVSYSLDDPQSFNRYSYVQNDPVNFVDPSGLNLEAPGSGGGGYCVRYHYTNPSTGEGFWGSWTCYGGGGGGGSRSHHAQKPSSAKQKACDDKIAGMFGGPRLSRPRLQNRLRY